MSAVQHIALKQPENIAQIIHNLRTTVIYKTNHVIRNAHSTISSWLCIKFKYIKRKHIILFLLGLIVENEAIKTVTESL